MIKNREVKKSENICAKKLLHGYLHCSSHIPEFNYYYSWILMPRVTCVEKTTFHLAIRQFCFTILFLMQSLFCIKHSTLASACHAITTSIYIISCTQHLELARTGTTGSINGYNNPPKKLLAFYLAYTDVTCNIYGMECLEDYVLLCVTQKLKKYKLGGVNHYSKQEQLYMFQSF